MRLTPRVAGFRLEYPAGFELECMAGFVGTRIFAFSPRCENELRTAEYSVRPSLPFWRHFPFAFHLAFAF